MENLVYAKYLSIEQIFYNPNLTPKSKKLIKTYQYIIKKKLYPVPAIRNNPKLFKLLKKHFIEYDSIIPVMKVKLKKEYLLLLLQKLNKWNTCLQLQNKIQHIIKILKNKITALDYLIQISIDCEKGNLQNIYDLLYDMYACYPKRAYKLASQRHRQHITKETYSNDLFLYYFHLKN